MGFFRNVDFPGDDAGQLRLNDLKHDCDSIEKLHDALEYALLG